MPFLDYTKKQHYNLLKSQLQIEVQTSIIKLLNSNL